MHAGTIAILAAVAIPAGLWLLFTIVGFIALPSTRTNYSDPSSYRQLFANGITSVAKVFGLLSIVIAIIGGMVLGAKAAGAYSCDLLAEDLSMEYDYSWARKCRVEVTLEDGREVWINPTNVRLTEDFRLVITDPRP